MGRGPRVSRETGADRRSAEEWSWVTLHGKREVEPCQRRGPAPTGGRPFHVARGRPRTVKGEAQAGTFRPGRAPRALVQVDRRQVDRRRGIGEPPAGRGAAARSVARRRASGRSATADRPTARPAERDVSDCRAGQRVGGGRGVRGPPSRRGARSRQLPVPDGAAWVAAERWLDGSEPSGPLGASLGGFRPVTSRAGQALVRPAGEPLWRSGAFGRRRERGVGSADERAAPQAGEEQRSGRDGRARAEPPYSRQTEGPRTGRCFT